MDISPLDFTDINYSFDKDEVAVEGEQRQRRRKEKKGGRRERRR